MCGISANRRKSGERNPEPDLAERRQNEGDSVRLRAWAALLKLGSEEQQATEGTFVYMRPNPEHGIKAIEVVMLFTMIKNAPSSPA
jgi:hypothetical protein